MLFSEKTDSELIRLFLDNQDSKAINALVRRHYQRLFQRFKYYLKDEHKANDLCQDLWLRVIKNLPSYKDQGKFEHYLNTIATNLLKDHWQTDKSGHEQSIFDNEGADLTDHLHTESGDYFEASEEIKSEHKSSIDYLTTHLIPNLPEDQRLVYLLRHESEYWDSHQPLQWQHLADLNGIDAKEATSIFVEARDKVIRNSITPSEGNVAEITPLSCLEKIIFLVWTQSQRVNKHDKLTESYFADLLGMPVNSFKTKYRAATKSLAEGLKKWK